MCCDWFFFFNDTATTEIYTYLTHSFPTRRSSDLGPARASLLTGLYQMTHRAVQNTIPLDSRFTNLGHELRKSGYDPARSEEHTSELQSLMRISYAVFCLKKKKNKQNYNRSIKESTLIKMISYISHEEFTSY